MANLIPIGLGILLLLLIYGYFNHNKISSSNITERESPQQADSDYQKFLQRERLVHQIAQQIRQSLDLDEVMATTVGEVQRFLQADRVLIYRLWDNGTGCAIHETVLPPYSSILGRTFPEEVFPQQYHQAYSLGKTRTIDDMQQADVEPCLAEFVKEFGVRAKLIVPIIQENRDGSHQNSLEKNSSDTATSHPYLWGLLIAHQCNNCRHWETWEVDLMRQLATQVAIAIQQSELYNQLQQLNTQLEQRVQQRTSELAAVNISLREEIAERQRTEIALRHTNDTLQALVTASPRAIVMLDLEGKVKIWNPAAERMFGWTEAEVINLPSPIHLDEPQEDCTTLQTSLLQGKTYGRVELRRHKKDGTAIDIIFSAAPLTDPKGKISGIVAVIADITEQKQRAEQLRLLQSVVVNTNDAIIITEAEPINEPGPRIIYVNEAFTRITGYQPEEVLGKTPRILQGLNTDRTELHKVRTALSLWEAVTVEVINYRKDGSEFWNEFSLVPVADGKGWYTHWIAVQRDTTGRKQTEQALRQSEERFRTLIENALDIIMILDRHGTIGYVSPSAEKILGYAVTDLLGKTLVDFIHPGDRAIIHERLENTYQYPEIQHPIEFRHRHQDGSWRILEAISQLFVEGAATPCVMVNARDITVRKRLEEIRLALEREKELSALKTRFFSMASHEFRTPLSTALAAAQVLENSQDEWNNTEKRLRNLHRIQNSVKNVVQLLDDILTINRAEAGNLTFHPKPFDLEFYCRQFVEEMRLSAGSNYTITFTCEGVSRAINLDEKLMHSIISNLLSNAIKYSPHGGNIQLKLEFQSNNVLLTVQDEGIGISLEDRRKLFEPFHRGKNVRTIPGTGLGLVVVKKCVDLHQGTINITSEVGVGTTCLVKIPYLSPQAM